MARAKAWWPTDNVSQLLHLATDADFESVPLKRLNLGAGGTDIDGFEGRDAKLGDSIFPLPDDDDSIDEIRASHVLEHFPGGQVQEIVNHWFAKLRPGGKIKIAVPDFAFVAKEYLAGKAVNVQGYLMGGQIDEHDFHKAAFDRDNLTEVLIDAGFERLFEWRSEIEDCASLDVSLNVGGYKPSGKSVVCEQTFAALSAPRFGPIFHFRMANAAFSKAQVRYLPAGGAYWHQVLSESIEELIARDDCRYVITADYDSVFRYEDVMELYRLMEAQPNADAICPLQNKRLADHALFGLEGDRDSIPSYYLDMNLLRIKAGHFGLTIFRADSLRNHKRPWMNATPSEDGKWGDGKMDADMDFWRRWHEAGLKLYLAPRVVIGHLQEMIAWPGRDLKPIHQSIMQYQEDGMPEGARP